MTTPGSGRARVRCSKPTGSTFWARRLRPQVVLLDIQLPGMDGFAVAERLAAESAAPAVVLISSRGRGAFRSRLEATPARGFITKAEFSGECLSSLLA
jgi:CheY-like chemotaxis protein